MPGLTIQTRAKAVLEALLEGKVVTAQALADRAGITERSIYRYIARLREQGHRIQSEAGMGYLMSAKAINISWDLATEPDRSVKAEI